MIIDLILNRRDGELYSPKQFYNDVMGYESVCGIGYSISRALDYGSEKQVKKALCDYIVNNDYNLNIMKYINSVKWL